MHTFMKRKLLLISFVVSLLITNFTIKAQIINQPANWPNASWTITGTYTASGFASDPTATSNFSWDDDLAGSGSQFDDISAESPQINLAAAVSGGEAQLQVSFDYVYRRVGDTIYLEWWDGSTWQIWAQLANNSSNLDYKGCTGFQSFVSQPLTISTLTATQLIEFKYRIHYNDSGFDWGFCMGSPTIISIATPACMEVSAINIDAANITESTASVDWNDNNGLPPANGWEIEYGPAGFAQGTGTVVPVAAHPYTLSGLTSSTNYDVYVRALCSAAEQSGWIGPVSFTTLLDVIGCGDQYVDSGGVGGNYSNDEDITQTFCPDVAGEVVTVQFLTFETENCCDYLRIYNGDSAAAPLLGEYRGTDMPPRYTSTDATGCLTFVFVSDFSNTRGGWTADITCDLPPTCLAPDTLAVSNITMDSADFTWNDINATAPANGWEIVIVPAGQSPDLGTPVAVANSPYLATGLNPSTLYDFYVRAVCDNAGTVDPSFWTGPLNFATDIAPPVCGGNFVDSGGPGGLYSNNENTTTTICPVNAGDVVTIQFLEFETENCCDYLRIYDGDSAAAPLLGEYRGTNMPPLLTSTHATGCLTFVFHSDGSVTRGGWLANILCGPPPTCFLVDTLNVDSVLTDEVTLSWNDPTNAVPPTTYIVEYGPVGFLQGTGTTVTGLNNPATITGLNSSTAYDFYVQSDCGGGDTSFWAGPISATTLCNVFTAPYVEDFEDAGNLDICWSQGAGNAEDWQLSNNVATPGHIGNNDDVSGTVTASGGYFAWVDDSNPHSNNTTLLSPLVDVSGLAIPALSFYFVSNDEGNSHVGFSVDVWDGTAWNVGMFTGGNNTAGWEEIFIDLSGLTITGPVQARFVVNETNGTDFYDDVAIDDVKFDEAPTCFPPNAITIANLNHNSADFSWNDNNTPAPLNGWMIEIVPAGATPTGVGTAVALENYTATGLNPDTDYDFYVWAVCDNAGVVDPSMMAGPLSFHTEIAPPACGEIFTDDGGTANNYSNGQDTTTVICPENAGDIVSVEFTMFDTEAGWDDMTIYDGDTATGTPLGVYDGTTLPPTFISTHPSGCLTFVFHSDGIINRPGWEANVICMPEPTCWFVTNVNTGAATTTSVSVSWTDALNTPAPAGGWDIEYGTVGFTPGTGAGTVVNAASSPFVVTGLSPSTNYDFYVSARCAADGSDSATWAGPVVGRTDDAPPPNDTCATAIPINTNLTCIPIMGNNILATSSSALEGEVTPDCADPFINNPANVLDVWFSFVVPNTNAFIIETSNAGGMVDSIMSAYSGSCGNLVELDCQDDSVIDPNSDNFRFSSITLRNLTVGETIYIRVWSAPAYTSAGTVHPNVQGAFNICVMDTGAGRSGSNLGFGDVQIEYHPNPVKDNLVIKANATISNVSVYNILGEQIISNTYNTKEVNLNTNILSSGTYFVRSLVLGKVKMFKIIKE